MEFWRTILDLARRKRVGFPLVGLALLGAVAVFFLVPPRYLASTSMVLTTPPAGGTTDPAKPLGRSNPLLQFSDGLRTTAGILILSMNTEAVAAELGVVKDGPVELTINDGRTNPSMLGILMNGPFVYVEVRSDSADLSRTVMARTQLRLRTELIRRQEMLGAPLSTFIGLVEVVPPAYPVVDRSGTWQAMGGAAFLVVALGLGAVYVVERRRVFRLRSGGGRSGEPSPATGEITATGEPSPATGEITATGEPSPATGEITATGEPSPATGEITATGEPSPATGEITATGEPSPATGEITADGDGEADHDDRAGKPESGEGCEGREEQTV